MNPPKSPSSTVGLMEPLHIRLISRDPTRHLFAGELAWLGRFGPLRPKARRQEQQQLLLLLWRQGVGGSFDFGECAHPPTVRQWLPNDKRADAFGSRIPAAGGRCSLFPLLSHVVFK